MNERTYTYKGYTIRIIEDNGKWNYIFEGPGGHNGAAHGYDSEAEAMREAEKAVLPRRSARENQLLAELGF